MRWILFTASLSCSAFACGTDAVGVQACRKIEHARCQWAQGCGVNLNVPVRRSQSTSPVDDCFRYYDDACLHGLTVPDPGDAAVEACIDAINTGDCNVVLHPETAPACAWLIAPPDAAAEAGSPSDAPAD
jgi:hypothetical protein